MHTSTLINPGFRPAEGTRERLVDQPAPHPVRALLARVARGSARRARPSSPFAAPRRELPTPFC